jgi:hypothetical protein
VSAAGQHTRARLHSTDTGTDTGERRDSALDASATRAGCDRPAAPLEQQRAIIKTPTMSTSAAGQYTHAHASTDTDDPRADATTDSLPERVAERLGASYEEHRAVVTAAAVLQHLEARHAAAAQRRLLTIDVVHVARPTACEKRRGVTTLLARSLFAFWCTPNIILVVWIVLARAVRGIPCSLSPCFPSLSCRCDIYDECSAASSRIAPPCPLGTRYCTSGTSISSYHSKHSGTTATVVTTLAADAADEPVRDLRVVLATRKHERHLSFLWDTPDQQSSTDNENRDKAAQSSQRRISDRDTLTTTHIVLLSPWIGSRNRNEPLCDVQLAIATRRKKGCVAGLHIQRTVPRMHAGQTIR